jgi:hypothetical protein
VYGCSAFDQQDIIVYDNPAAPTSGGNITICQSVAPATLSVTAPGGSTVDWYDAASGGTLLQSGSSTYSTSTAGTYYAESRNTTSGCLSTSRTAVSLTINPNPVLSFSSTPATCISGTNGTINLTVTGVSGALTYLWSNGATTEDLSGLVQGTYTVTVTKTSTGCTKTGSTTVGHTCPAPTGLATGAITSTSANLSWTSSCAINYRIRYKRTSVSTWTYKPLTASTTQLLTGLTPGFTYEAQVEAFCAAQDSSGYTSSVTWTNPTGTCANPTVVTTTNVTAHCATFNWNGSIDPFQWQVEYKTTNMGAVWVPVSPQPQPYERTYTQCGLDANQQYQWHIRAKCNAGSGGWLAYVLAPKFKTLSAKLDGESVTEQVQPDLNLYPNPNGGQFVVALHVADNTNSEADVQITNMLGQNIYFDRTAIVNGELFAEVKFDAGVPGGTYFVRVMVGDKVYTGQIVYQK